MAIPDELVTKDRQAFNSIVNLAETVVSRNVPDLSTLEQAEAGYVLRRLAAGTMLSFGNIATETSRLSYEAMAAGAQVGGSFTATTLPKLQEFIDNQVDPVVGWSMGTFQQGRFAEAASFLSQSVGRVVGNVYRETMSNNALTDKRARRYVRVAGPGACAFCAFAAVRADIVTNSDAKFHANCRCTTMPAFSGMAEYRPSYYDKYEEDAWSAEGALRADQDAARAAFYAANPDARRRQFWAAYPELSITPQNILARMRETGDYR